MNWNITQNDLLIAAATKLELQPFMERCSMLSRRGSWPGSVIYTGELNNVRFNLVITGVGVINAAHGITRAIIEAGRPSIIVQAGIGGAFGYSGLSLGDIALAERETYIHTGVERLPRESKNTGVEGLPRENQNTGVEGLPRENQNTGVEGLPQENQKGICGHLFPHDPLPFNIMDPKPETPGGHFFMDADLCRKIHGIITPESHEFKVIRGNFITVSTITASAGRTAALIDAFSPCMESMEGAAAAHLASLYDIPFIEVRAVSNMAGIREKSKWNIPLAVKNLSVALIAMLKCPAWTFETIANNRGDKTHPPVSHNNLNLGVAMITAQDIMEVNVITVKPDTEITDAIEILLKNHINGVPVVDNDGTLVGILCQSDLVFQQKTLSLPPILTFLDGIFPLSSSRQLKEEMEKIAATTVEKAMVKKPVTVTPDTPLSKIAALMVEKHFHTIPVVENGAIKGIIGKEDILKTLMKDQSDA
ncbi:MAG: futalosine hydrolase [Desulfamplus sp.]|nr:futalosine hydrolase [Desulfamplus sp.]